MACRGDASQWADIATVAFEYDEHIRFLDDPSLFAHDPEGQLALLPRDLAEESRREAELRTVGLHRDTAPRAPLEGAGPQFQLRTHDWTRFRWTTCRAWRPWAGRWRRTTISAIASPGWM